MVGETVQETGLRVEGATQLLNPFAVVTWGPNMQYLDIGGSNIQTSGVRKRSKSSEQGAECDFLDLQFLMQTSVEHT